MGNKGSLKKGNGPWNKGLKGIHLSPETEFKPGQRVREKSNTWRGGIQKPKSDCTYLYAGPNKRIRRPKHVYESHNGKIPNGWCVIHLDKNKDNDEIENLMIVPRAILMRLNSNRDPIEFNKETIENEIIKYLKNKVK